MASASSARRRCWWAPPPRSPLLVAAEASVVAVSAAAAFAVRAWGLAWVWAWVAFTDRMATVAIPTAATIPIMATRALAMRFGDASGQPTVGEYAAFRFASDCGCAVLNLNGRGRIAWVTSTTGPPALRATGRGVLVLGWGGDPLSTAIPHIADRGRGPARAEPAAVP